MSKFRPYSLDQAFLLPPDIRDWLPDGHLAKFVSNMVDSFDLSTIIANSRLSEVRGRPAHNPAMLLKVLIYGYIHGLTSSRKLERATQERVDFRVLAGNEHPDHDCIAAFRKRHVFEFERLFVDVLRLCRDMGLVKLGHISIDGTKMSGNASRYKTFSAKDLSAMDEQLRKKVEALIREAEEADAAEDALYGDRVGDELPDELTDAKSQRARIAEAMERLRAQAKTSAQEQADKAREAAAAQDEQRKSGKRVGRNVVAPNPDQIVADLMESDKTRINLTDPDSNLMYDGSNKAIIQGYNAQVAVDSTNQVIVAANVTTEANDKQQLVPMAAQVEANLGVLPTTISADSGYFSEAAVTDDRLSGVRLLVPPNRKCTQGETKDNAVADLLAPEISPVGFEKYKEPPTMADIQEAVLQEPQNRRDYHQRNAIVEPVFGQTKHNRGIRRMALRGLEAVKGEWHLICMAHNIMKLFRASQPKQTEKPRHRTSWLRHDHLVIQTKLTL